MVPAMLSNEVYQDLPKDAQDAIDLGDWRLLIDVIQRKNLNPDKEIMAWLNNRALETSPKGYVFKVERYLGRFRIELRRLNQGG